MRNLRTRRAAGAGVLLIALVVALIPTAAFGSSGNENHPDHWKNKYPNAVACYKYDPPGQKNEHGKLTNGGKAVVLNPYKSSWPGDRWEVLVVKGGQNGREVYELPKAGVDYHPPKNNNGKYPEVSHWIVCKGQSPKPPKTVKVVFEKKWKGDAEGSARFFIDGEGPFQPGEAVDVTALAGKRVRITEEVGLPEGHVEVGSRARSISPRGP